MAKITPSQAAQKLGQRIAQSGAAYLAGVQAVTENPAQKAIAAKAKWEAGIMDAIANNRFEKGLSKVTLQGWKQSVADFGQNRYTSSATKAEKNYAAFAQEFFPFLDTVSDEVDSMPNMTIEDSIARMAHNVRRLHGWRNS